MRDGYIQVGVWAPRNPVTGAFGKAEPIYVKGDGSRQMGLARQADSILADMIVERYYELVHEKEQEAFYKAVKEAAAR